MINIYESIHTNVSICIEYTNQENIYFILIYNDLNLNLNKKFFI